MAYKILADGVVLVHFLWVLFLFFGAIGGIRNKAVRMIHLSGLAFAFIIQIFGWYCPLTYLEVWLRHMHDSSGGYTGSFIIHYVEKFVYPDIAPEAILTMTILLVLICK